MRAFPYPAAAGLTRKLKDGLDRRGVSARTTFPPTFRLVRCASKIRALLRGSSYRTTRQGGTLIPLTLSQSGQERSRDVSTENRQVAAARWTVAGALAAVILIGSPVAAWASLGGNVGSVEADRAQMNAAVQVTDHDTYTVHTMTAPGGTVVNEFVSSEGGKVFAVAWHGQFPPQMQQILGTYFQEYTAALADQEKHYGHRPLNLQTQDLIVQTGGHMRAYTGRAYLPDALPQGVTIADIQ
jgi:hypothetical protein